MESIFLRPRRNICVAFVLCTIIWSCENDDRELTPEEKQEQSQAAAQDNSQIIVATQEVLDVTAVALLDKGITNGRVPSGSRWGHNGLACQPAISASYDVTKNADSLIYSGTITIDYGDGSACEDSTSMRSGKIVDSFTYIIGTSDSVTFSSTETITFEGFHKDTVRLDGTFTCSYADGVRTVMAEGASIMYDDGTSITWNSDLTYTYNDGETPWQWNDDSKTLTGSVSGTTREGNDFNATVTQDVTFVFECFQWRNIPVAGTVEITSNGIMTLVDYGDGTCDKVYTVTSGDETTEMTFDKYNKHG